MPKSVSSIATSETQALDIIASLRKGGFPDRGGHRLQRRAGEDRLVDVAPRMQNPPVGSDHAGADPMAALDGAAAKKLDSKGVGGRRRRISATAAGMVDMVGHRGVRRAFRSLVGATLPPGPAACKVRPH